jgi:hypothetical protein
MNSWNIQIKGAKTIILPQDWGHMLRLILAIFSIKEIEERHLKLQEWKPGQKYLWKSRKWKIFQHIERGDSIQTHECIDANQEFTRCGNHSNILPLIGRLRRSLTSLLSSPRHDAHPHLAKQRLKSKGGGRGIPPTTTLWLYLWQKQKTRMLLWAKEKLHLMKGRLIWLPLCRTRWHQTNRLMLHFHVTSMMMPRAPPAVAPSPVLRQNWETEGTEKATRGGLNGSQLKFLMRTRPMSQFRPNAHLF